MSERSRQYRQVIAFFLPEDDLALTPGGFMELLIRTVCKADPSNRARLRRSFPHVVDGVDAMQHERSGRQILANIIQSDEEGPL